MATKPRKTSRKSSPAEEAAPAESTPAQAHNIWLAGLGALASAQADAQAEGNKAFEALVRQGLEMQARTQALAKEQWAEAAQRMGAMGVDANAATGGWGRLGGIFEDRVARALASMGMPSALEVCELKQRVEALERELEALRGGKPAATRPAARKSATRRQSS